MKRISVLVLGLLAAGCSPDPVVTAYNGFSVRVTAEDRIADERSQQKADRICASRGMIAEYASTDYRGFNPISHLYLCLDSSRLPPAPPTTQSTAAQPAAAQGGAYFSSAGQM